MTVSANSIDGNAEGLQNLDEDPVNAINNWWGKATGPSGGEGVEGTGDQVVGLVDYRPWLLSENGTIFDQTMILMAAGEWTLFSAPRLLSAVPEVEDDEGGAVVIFAHVNGAFIDNADPDFDGDVIKPVSAFYVNAANLAAIGFIFENPPDPDQTTKALISGWNLIGTNNSAKAIDELSSIQETSQTAGMITLFVPDIVNVRKEIDSLPWSGPGNADRDLNASPISDLPETPLLSIWDGYWVFSTGARTYSKQLK